MDLTNFTSTSLGYVMAFLLPGISAIYAASMYSHPLRHQVDKLASSGSGAWLFLLGLLASLIVGLLLLPIRAVVYEEVISRVARVERLEAADFQGSVSGWEAASLSCCGRRALSVSPVLGCNAANISRIRIRSTVTRILTTLPIHKNTGR